MLHQAIEDEGQDQNRGERLSRDLQQEVEGQGEHPGEDRLLEQATAGRGQDLLPLGLVQPLGLLLEQGQDQLLPRHGLDGFDPLEDVHQAPGQGLGEAGLLQSSRPTHPDESLE
jgi:hypothetical protein